MARSANCDVHRIARNLAKMQILQRIAEEEEAEQPGKPFKWRTSHGLLSRGEPVCRETIGRSFAAPCSPILLLERKSIASAVRIFPIPTRSAIVSG
jgi:hypothetical protein